MARQYPRFIYSEPQDTKSKGPFIVHTLFPQMIAKVSFTEDGYHYVDPLEVFVASDREKIDQVVYSMHDWYTSMRMKEANLSADFYIRSSNIAQKFSGNDFFYNAVVSISMIFKPVMGARLDIAKDNWKISVDIADDDTYNSVFEKLREEYKEKYQVLPDWPL